jgi:hypothetical protein
VAVVARRKERPVALAAEIGGLAIETDVTDREQAQAAVERTADRTAAARSRRDSRRLRAGRRRRGCVLQPGATSPRQGPPPGRRRYRPLRVRPVGGRGIVYPLPANGILVAMTVRNWTLASSGRPAM